MRRFILPLTPIATVIVLCAALLTTALFPPHSEAQLYGYVRNANPSNPTGTTSTTGVAMGVGGTCQLIAQKTGVVLFIVTYTASNGTAGDGFTGQIVYGPNADKPANGAAIPADWTALGIPQGASNGGTTQENQTIVAIAGGVPLGSVTAFDLKFAAVTGGTATPVNIICTAVELAN